MLIIHKQPPEHKMAVFYLSLFISQLKIKEADHVPGLLNVLDVFLISPICFICVCNTILVKKP